MASLPATTRRTWLKSAGLTAASLTLMRAGDALADGEPDIDGNRVADETRKFILSCARPDGGYGPSPDPDYGGNSDTSLSDLAAVTYAAVLAKTMNWKLPEAERSIAFAQNHQQPDGSFVNRAGGLDPQSDGAVLYNTVQGVVSLRALGARPKRAPSSVLDRFFKDDRYKKLPWYTTSFYPLFYAALEQPFPDEYRQALADWMIDKQPDDGYLGDHVAAAFHMAHFYRLLGEPTPKAAAMVERCLADQRPDGGWNIKVPDWDVHACFDALFILRQLGGDDPRCRRAIERGARWALRCRNADGGFGHYPGWHSDMDAVYFQFGALVQAGLIPGARRDLPDAQTLSWGHAMQPGKTYPVPSR